MKIRTDFVTNSSSTSYIIMIEKIGSDNEILKELEDLSGFGPRGAKAIFDKFKPAVDWELDKARLPKTSKAVSTTVTTSDSEYWDRAWIEDVGQRLCDKVFSFMDNEVGNQAKTFRVVYKGERH